MCNSYVVENDNGESFEAVSWASNGNNLFILAGGLHYDIRVINYPEFTLDKILSGHVCPVTEIKHNPFTSTLALSASKDSTIRLWNISTGVCLVRFDGGAGVLSADFHLSNKYVLVSSGTDKYVRVWYMEGCWQSGWMNKQETIKGTQYGGEIIPDGISLDDGDCVECIRFLDFALISQIGEDQLILSKFLNYGSSEKDREAIKRIQIGHSCKTKFDPTEGYLAVGNKKGELYILDCNQPTSTKIITISSARGSNAAIRQTVISADRSSIVSIDETGVATVWYKATVGSTSTTPPVVVTRDGDGDITRADCRFLRWKKKSC